MINYVIKNTRKWLPQFKMNTSYRKMFNQALNNFELNKMEEKALIFSLVPDEKNRKAGY